jgi:uncharacterized protein YjbI with pentapeptide repeats
MSYLHLPKLVAPDIKIQKCNFSNAMLEFADFQGKETEIRMSNFHMTNLKYANFEQATLYYTDFTLSLMKKANLKNTRLWGSHFKDADLLMATLEGADLGQNTNWFGAKLIQTDMRNVRNLSDTQNLEFAVTVETKILEEDKKIWDALQSTRKSFLTYYSSPKRSNRITLILTEEELKNIKSK